MWIKCYQEFNLNINFLYNHQNTKALYKVHNYIYIYIKYIEPRLSVHTKNKTTAFVWHQLLFTPFPNSVAHPTACRQAHTEPSALWRHLADSQPLQVQLVHKESDHVQESISCEILHKTVVLFMLIISCSSSSSSSTILYINIIQYLSICIIINSRWSTHFIQIHWRICHLCQIYPT